MSWGASPRRIDPTTDDVKLYMIVVGSTEPKPIGPQRFEIGGNPRYCRWLWIR